MKETSTEYTPTEALKCLTYITKKKLYEDMNREKNSLSYREVPRGKKTKRYIEGSELARYYGQNFTPSDVTETSPKNENSHSGTLQGNVENVSKNTELRIEVEVLRQRMSDKDEKIDYLKEERNEWKEIAQKRELLIEDMRNKAPEKPPEAQESVLLSRSPKNDSTWLYELLWTCIAALIAAVLIVITKDAWLPYAQTWLNP